MKIWVAILLGIIQGIAEFLPLSSSGHLLLVENFLCTGSSTFFNLLLHLATLFAVILFFWKELLWCIKNPLSKQTQCLCLSTICTAFVAFGISKIPSATSGLFLGPSFIATGILLFISQFVRQRKKKGNYVPKPISTSKAFAVGVAQGFAILPGLSRCGATISTLKILGIESEPATTYSFLLSIPVVVGGIVFELSSGKAKAIHIGVLPCLIAFCVASIVGLFSLKLLKIIAKKDKWWIFAPYVLILGILITIWQYA